MTLTHHPIFPPNAAAYKYQYGTMLGFHKEDWSEEGGKTRV